MAGTAKLYGPRRHSSSPWISVRTVSAATRVERGAPVSTAEIRARTARASLEFGAREWLNR
jgi:hypothetical protein